jgi:hypothetical protein
MSYLSIPDFKFGMDRRRKRVSGVPGTLWVLKNAHLTRGGDIERAKKFVEKYELPAGTYGLAKVRRQLYAFGSADLSGSMPTGVLYQRLQAPSTPAMVRILDAKVFAAKIYAIAEYADGNIYHFYDGTRVSQWETLAAANSDYSTLAAYLEEKINSSEDVTALASASTILITAQTPGTSFTISAAAVDNGIDATEDITVTQVQANVAEVEETRATGTVTITGGSSNPGVNKISGITVDGVALMDVAINWVLSNNATASAVATEINNRTATHGYTAVAVTGTITLTASPGTGATVNGDAIVVTEAGNVTSTDSGTISGGVTYVAPVAQIESVALSGLYEEEDKFTITINGTGYVATGLASGMGVNVFVSKSRVWSVAGSLLNGCQINDPTDWSDATASTGYVSINVANQSEGTERLVGMAPYQTYAAVFSRNEIRLYTLDEDATLIEFVQSLDNTGAMAGRSPIGYGANDVYYLDQTGIRSIRPRDNVNAAFVSDVGTAVDTFVREHVDSLPADTVARGVTAIEPIDSRLWLSLGERIYVLSFFPSSKVNAWSYYEPPADITEFARIGDRLYCRGGDVVYLYGGDSGAEYPDDDEQNVTVQLPFLTAEKPAHKKEMTGFDAALDNEWLVEVLIDPNDETKTETVGRINRNTFHLPDTDVPFRTSAFAFELTCSRAGAATLSALTCHFEPEDPAR